MKGPRISGSAARSALSTFKTTSFPIPRSDALGQEHLGHPSLAELDQRPICPAKGNVLTRIKSSSILTCYSTFAVAA